MKSGPVIIGITGGTGSGKTTVAASICSKVGRDRIEWISHDSYYREFRDLDPEGRHHINFDHPDSLETEALVRDLDRLIEGHAIEVPVYDFTTHSRLTATQRVEPKRVIIVEGSWFSPSPISASGSTSSSSSIPPPTSDSCGGFSATFRRAGAASTRSCTSTSRRSARCTRSSWSRRNAMPT
jgi:pantothenate kinase-related protein Tda10